MFFNRMNVYFIFLSGETNLRTAAAHLDITPDLLKISIGKILKQNVIEPNGYLLWKDKNSVFQRVNRNAQSLFPSSCPPMGTFTSYEVSPKELADIYRGHDELCLKSKAPLHIEGSVEHKELGIIHAIGKEFPLFDDDDEIQGFLVATHSALRLNDLPFAKALRIMQQGMVHLFIKKKSYPIVTKFGDISLSAHECECLLYLIGGKSAKDTAHYTGASPRTIEWHLENVRMKLGCTHRAELVDRLLENGFVSHF